MQLTPRQYLMQFGNLLQGTLFGALEKSLGALSEQAQLLVSVLTLVSPGAALLQGRWPGRPAKHRAALASAFVAKAIYGFSTTRQLLERLPSDPQLLKLCGWNSARQRPHESTFSRAFEEFAHSELPQRLHAAVIQKTQHARLIGHIARDATAIEAREKFPEPKPKKAKYQRRPKRAKASERGTRLDQQRQQPLARQLSELSRQCSIGVKKNSQGHEHYWRGYKLHLDVADGQIPISALLTGASVHDSQAAIPLMTMTGARVSYLYDLMDAAYDAAAIHNHSRALGHAPIVDRNFRADHEGKAERGREVERLKLIHMPDFDDLIYDFRTMAERVNARLKDEFGARFLRVRGALKVKCHLMFGIVALAVDQIIRVVDLQGRPRLT